MFVGVAQKHDGVDPPHVLLGPGAGRRGYQPVGPPPRRAHPDAAARVHDAPLADGREEVGRVVEVGQTKDVAHLVSERPVQDHGQPVLTGRLGHDRRAPHLCGAVVHEDRLAEHDVRGRYVERRIEIDVALPVCAGVEQHVPVVLREVDGVRRVGRGEGVSRERLHLAHVPDLRLRVVVVVAHVVREHVGRLGDRGEDVELDLESAVGHRRVVAGERRHVEFEVLAVVRRSVEGRPVPLRVIEPATARAARVSVRQKGHA